jgi:uncharacterized repeat protein (TIGR03803 family)
MSHAELRGWRLGVAFAILLLGSGLPGLVPVASAQAVYETVHSFIQSPGRPIGRLLTATDGRIFGVTAVGGQYRGGSIFVAAQDGAGAWTVSTFHQFRAIDGITPLAGLAFGLDGAMYGTTAQGGAHGGGTVYRITLGGAFQVLHHLRPATDGFAPLYEPLALGLDGAFYGTTYAGGLHGRGTIFRVTPLGAFTLLRIFAGIDGAYPTGGLVRGFDGAFYGTTTLGGPSDMGTVFRVTAQGNFTRLHAFSTEHALARPSGGLVQAADGTLFGVAGFGTCIPFTCPFQSPAAFGDGGVFRITPNGVFGYAARFAGSWKNGPGVGKPQPGLTIGPNGRIYGVQQDFFDTFDVFAVDPTSMLDPPFFVGAPGWVNLFVGRFQQPSVQMEMGHQALGSVMPLADGTLLLSTSVGAVGGQGALVQVKPGLEPDAEVIHSFASAGYGPTGRLTLGADSKLYGTAYLGGSSLCRVESCGTVFSVNPDDTVVDIYANLFGSPFGDLGETSAGTLLVGAIRNQAWTGTATGTIPTNAFEITAAGTVVRYLGLIGFQGPTEAGDGGIYGMFYDQFNLTNLWLARAEPGNGENITPLHEFTGPDGLLSYGAMLKGIDGSLYGTTVAGGSAGFGTIFRFTPGGSLTTLHHFNGTEGANPFGALVQGSDGRLYGTTTHGGLGAGLGNGVVFRIAPDGSGFAVLHAFGPGEGTNPIAGLSRAPGDVFYGTTIAGGTGAGSVFALSAAGAFETLHVFAAGEGVAPMGGVTVMPDGSLYGTTVAGGAGGVGVIYKLTIAPTLRLGRNREQ